MLVSYRVAFMVMTFFTCTVGRHSIDRSAQRNASRSSACLSGEEISDTHSVAVPIFAPVDALCVLSEAGLQGQTGRKP